MLRQREGASKERHVVAARVPYGTSTSTMYGRVQVEYEYEAAILYRYEY
jgi:hypothetical protein